MKLSKIVRTACVVAFFHWFIFATTTASGQVANAGADQTICTNHTILNGNNPGVGVGTWSVKVGYGVGTFVNANDYGTEVQDVGFGPNIYIWTLVKGGVTTTDEVQITSWASYAGVDQVVCADSVLLVGSNPSLIPGGLATGVWTTSGAASISSPSNYTTWVKGLTSGDNYFVWTITDAKVGGCPPTIDQVKITYSPTAINGYTVSGGGSYCPGGTGLSVTLNGSQVGLNYQLYKNGVAWGAPVVGTGGVLVWNNQTVGTYTVFANSGSTCTQIMSNSVTISQYPDLIIYNVSGNASYCPGMAGGSVSISGSSVGVNYQLQKDGAPYGVPQSGTGSSLSWSNLPVGVYTVMASNINCSKLMSGSLTIVSKVPPPVANLSGTGAYCAGASGLPIALDGSVNGFWYQLYKGGVADGSVLVGNGGALSWSNKLQGTYTAVAQDPSSGCTSNMTGAVVLTENPLPTVYTFSGAVTAYCIGSAGVTLALSGSEAGSINYQLVKNGANFGAPKAGTGVALSWTGLLVGTYSVVATNTTTGCSIPMTGTVTVIENPLPLANAGSDRVACVGSSVTLTATGGVSYLWNPGGASGASYTVSPLVATNYIVQVTDANGCSKNDTVRVTISALPVISAGPDVAVCSGSVVSINATGGNTYVWSPAAGLSSTTVASPVASPTNTTTYTVVGTDVNGCQSSDNVVVTVNTTPIANAGTDQTICTGDNVSLVAGGGGTYAWSTGQTTQSITVSPGSTTTYTVVVTNANGCSSSDNVLVTVNPRPTANAGTDKVICAGNSVTLTASGGATYLWSNGATTASINVAPIATTTYSVTATSALGCSSSDDVQVTVNPKPIANAGADVPICVGKSATLTATGGVSYLWNPIGEVNATVTVSPAATTTYSVTVTDANSCQATDAVVVTVNPLPVVFINNLATDYCADHAAVTITGIPTGATGVFTPVAGLVDLGNGTATFNPSGVPSGTTYNITYTYTDGNGCVNNVTRTAMVRSETSPTPTITNLLPVYCDTDAGSYTITGNPTNSNGQFIGLSAPGFIDNGNGTGTLRPNLLGTGTYTLTYQYTDPVTACIGAVSGNFEIGVPIQITNLNSSYCEDVGPFVLQADRIGGKFYIDNTYSGDYGVATFDPSTIGVGVHTVAYKVTNAINCSNTNTISVEVFPLPVATFTLNGQPNTSVNLKFCQNGGLVTLAGNPNSGGVFSCATGGVSGNMFNPAAVAVGNHTIQYTFTSAGGCVSSQTAVVTVEAVPTVSINGLAAAYCNSTTTFEISGSPLNSGGATPVAGVWTSPWANPAIFLDKGNGNADFNPSLVPLEGSYTITYQVAGANGCVGSASQSVAVNFTPSVDFVGLPGTICKNTAPVTLTGTPLGAQGVFSGAGITDNGNGTATFNPAGVAEATHTITYTYTIAATGCLKSATHSTVVKPIPTAYAVTGGGSYCQGAAGVLVGLSQSTSGVIYKLVLNGIDTVATLTGDGNPLNFGLQITAGSYTIIGRNPAPNSCKEPMLGSATVTILPLPADAQPITGNTTVCPLSAHVYTVPVLANATTYEWTLPVGATITGGSGTNSVTVFFGAGAVSGNISVRGSNACGFGASSSLGVTVSALPDAAGAIVGKNLVCRQEAGVTYQVPVIANATTYDWTVPAGATIVSGAGTRTIVVDYGAAAFSGNIIVLGRNACGVGATASFAVSVVPLPVVTITDPTETIKCTGNIITINATASVAGGAFTWTALDGGNITGGGNTANVQVNASGRYAVLFAELVNGCKATDTTSVSDDKTAPANVTIVPSNPSVLTCSNTSISLTGSTSSAFPVSYSWTTSGTGNITGGSNSNVATVDKAGTYELTVRNLANSCATVQSIVVVDNLAPPQVSVVTPESEVLNCLVSQVTLSGSSTTAGASLQWSGPGTILNPNSVNPTVDVAGTYTLLVTGPNGCTASKQVEVLLDMAKPTISVNASPLPLTCDRSTVTLSGSSTTPGASLLWTGPGIASGATQENPTVFLPGTYTLTVTHPTTGCSDFRTVNVIENRVAPDVTFATVPDEISCNQPTVLLQATTLVANPQYTWSTLDGAIVGSTTLSSAIVSKRGTYSISIKNLDNGCVASGSQSVVDNLAAPVLTILVPEVVTCAKPTIFLSASSSVMPVNASWTTLDGTIVGGVSSLTPEVSKAGTYSLLAVNSANGCSATSSVSVSEDKTLPIITITTTPDTLNCNRTLVTLYGSAPNSTLLWSGPVGATIVNPTSGTPQVDKPGLYTLVATGINGCTSSKSITVVQNIEKSQNITIQPPADLTCSVTSVELVGSTTTAGASFAWVSGVGGNITTAPNTDRIWVDAAAQYTLHVTHPLSRCVDSAKVVVNSVKTIPTVSIPTLPVPLTCALPTTTLSVTTEVGNTILWSGPGTITNSTTATPTVNAAGTYTATVTNPVSGCTAIGTVVVTEDRVAPTVSITPPSTITCTVPQITLQGNSPLINRTQVWTTANGSFVDAPPYNSLAVNINKGGTYNLTVTSTINGCSASSSVTVVEDKVVPNITVTPVAAEKITCAVSQVMLNGYSTTPGAQLSWSGPGNITNATSSSPTVDASGTYVLTVTAPNGCISTANVVVNEDKTVPVVPVILAPEALTCSKTSVLLKVSPAVSNVDYLWTTTGVGTIATPTASETYVNAVGTYAVKLTHLQSGCTSSSSVVVAEDKTTSVASIAPGTFVLTCTNAEITLDGTASMGINPLWTASNGGHIKSGATTLSPIVDAAGDYTLTVYNATTGCSSSASVTVTADASLPTITIDPFPATITCTAPQVTLSGQPDDAGNSYVWTTSPGHIVSGGSSFNPVVDAPGTYIITVTSTATGCKNSAAINVVQDKTLPTVSVGVPVLFTCNVSEVQLSATATPVAVSYLWTASAGGSIKAANDVLQNPTVLAPGNYNVLVTSPVNGCQANQSVVVGSDYAKPNIVVNKVVDNLTCSRTTVMLSGSSTTPNVQYQWTTSGAGNITNAFSTNPVVDAIGYYKLTVKSNANGCSIFDSVLVSENKAIPNVSVTAVPAILSCTTSQVPLTGNSTTSNVTYLWTGPVAISTPTAKDIVVTYPGVYTLTVADATNGCSASANTTVVENKVIPAAPVVTSASSCFGQPATSLSAVGSGIKWYSDASLSSAYLVNAGNTFTPTSDVAVGTYTYFATQTDAANGCESPASIGTYTVVALPSMPIASDESSCFGSAVPLLTASGDNINWYNAVGNPSVGTGNSFNTGQVNVGVYPYWVTQTSSSTGCESQPLEVKLTINPLPSAPMVSNSSLSACSGAANPVFTATGTGIKWYSDALLASPIFVGNSFTSTESAVGIHTYYATQTLPTGCEGPSTTVTFTILPLPAVFDVGGSGSYCQGSVGREITLSGSQAGVTYSLILNGTSTITTKAGTGSALSFGFHVAEGVYTVSALSSNGCTAIMSGGAALIESKLPSTPAVPSGLTPVCQGQTATYTVAVPANTSSFTWFVPSGVQVVSGLNSNTVSLKFTNTAISGGISVKAVNSCGESSMSPVFSVSVNELPKAAGVIAGPSEVCQGSSGHIFEIAPITNATSYAWTLPAGATVESGTGTNRITLRFAVNEIGGTITVKGVNSCGEGAVSPSFAVVAKPLPTVSAGADLYVCGPQIAISGNTPNAGATGLWTVAYGPGIVVNPALSQTSVSSLRMGDNRLVWTITSNGCSVSDTVVIYNRKVAVDAGDDATVCARNTNLGAKMPLTGAQWSVVEGTGTIFDLNSPLSAVASLTQGINRFVWSVNNGGCISADTVTITNDRPLTPDAGPNQAIPAINTLLAGSVVEPGTVGNWSVLSGGGQFVDAANPTTEVTNLAPGVSIFKWTVTRNGCSLSDSVYIENTLIAAIDAGQNQILCTNTTILSGTEPIVGIGEWSVVKGSARFANFSQYNTEVFDLAPGENILKWTVKGSSLSSTYDTVVIHNYAVTVANAGLDQFSCSNAGMLMGNVPTYGNGSWTLISGSGDIADPLLYNSPLSNLGEGVNKFKWTISNAFCITTDIVEITNGTPTTANAGLDQTLCQDSTTLRPNTPTYGIGHWTVISGSANFAGNKVTNLASGANTLRWVITNGGCVSTDDVIVTSNKPTTPNAGLDRSICVDNVQLAANAPSVGSAVWTIINGSGTLSSFTNPSATVTGLSAGKNIFRWTITQNGCVEFDEVVITNNFVLANAGTDQALCANSTTLLGSNPSPGTGSWAVLEGSSATIATPLLPTSNVTGLRQGSNKFRWTVNNQGCISSDEVEVVNNLPTVAFAGANRAICADNTTLEGNMATHGVGTWTLLSGSAVITNPAQNNTTVTSLGKGLNVFRWTIVNNGCTSYSEVIITNNLPDNVDAGLSQRVCSDSVQLVASKPTIGTGLWSVVQGSAYFDNPNSYTTMARNLGKDLNILKWTVTTKDCQLADTVHIYSSIPTRAVAGPDQIVCSSTAQLAANVSTSGIGEWIIVSGAGVLSNSNDPKASVSSLGLGTNTLRWIIAKNGCQSYDDITIQNNLPSAPYAGDDSQVCADSVRLYAESPIVGTGVWSLVSGDGDILTPNQNQTVVSALGFGANTFRWTVTNKNCSLFDDIVISSNLAEVNAGPDQEVYTSNITLIGNLPASGTGLWQISAGSGSIQNPNNFETAVTNLGAGANIFKWTITNNGCVASDEVVVDYLVMPTAGFNASGLAGCPPMDVTFTNTSVGGNPYTWDFGDGATSNQTNTSHTYMTPGTYIVTLTAGGPLGKVDVAKATIVVYDMPNAKFDVAPKTVYIPGQHVSCFNYSTLAKNSTWDFGDGGVVEEFSPVYNYRDTGLYDVMLTVVSENGCRDSLVQLSAIHVLARSQITFPEGFTPNPYSPSGGIYDPLDRTNDVFYPIVIVGGIQNYKMEVFNRLGVKVFESSDINIGWDGYYKNKLLPEDVYIYRISGIYNSGEPFNKVGDVLLMRK
jgi:hypothetical protein